MKKEKTTVWTIVSIYGGVVDEVKVFANKEKAEKAHHKLCKKYEDEQGMDVVFEESELN